MGRLVIYLEFSCFPFTGASGTYGTKVDFGPIEKNLTYSEIASNVNMCAMADYFGVPHGSVSIITPEEYKEKYGYADEEGKENEL